MRTRTTGVRAITCALFITADRYNIIGAFESAPAPPPIIELGFEEHAPPGAFSPSDDWGLASPAPIIPIHQPQPATAAAKIHTKTHLAPAPHANRASTPTRSSTACHATPASETRGAAQMTKEEKAAEMARRKEERKQVSTKINCLVVRC